MAILGFWLYSGGVYIGMMAIVKNAIELTTESEFFLSSEIYTLKIEVANTAFLHLVLTPTLF